MKFDSEPLNQTDVERKVEIEDQKVVISSDLSQEVDAETFMDMFEEKVNKHREITRQLRDMQNQIDQLLEDKKEDMHNMQVIDANEDKKEPVGHAERTNLINEVPIEGIETYVNLVKAKKQMEQKRDQLEDVEEDILQLKSGAEEVVETFESFEMPNNYELVMGEINGEGTHE